MHEYPYPKEPTEFMDYCRSLDYDELCDLETILNAAVIGSLNSLDNICINQYVESKDGRPHIKERTIAALRWDKWRLFTVRSYKKRSLPRMFMTAAKATLPTETYTQLLAAASNGHS